MIRLKMRIQCHAQSPVLTNEIQARVKSGAAFGCMLPIKDIPPACLDRHMLPVESISHHVLELHETNGGYECEVETLDTPCGRLLEAMAKHGVPLEAEVIYSVRTPVYVVNMINILVNHGRPMDPLEMLARLSAGEPVTTIDHAEG